MTVLAGVCERVWGFVSVGMSVSNCECECECEGECE